MAEEIKTPHFLNWDGSLSGDGQALVAFIEGQFVEADHTNDLQTLNNLSGMIGHYYTNVYKLHTMKPEQWVKDYPNGAMGAWSAKQFVEAKLAEAQRNEETAQKTNTLEAEFAKLKESIEAEVAALKQENEALRAQLGSKKQPVKKPDPTPEAPEGEPAPEPEA